MHDSERLTIAEMAERTGVSVHTLRYYERTGLLEKVERDRSSGHRRYTEEDVARVRFLCCLRTTGMPIRRVRRYVDLMRAGDATAAERRALLVTHRQATAARMAETARHLEAIEAKIRWYDEQYPSRASEPIVPQNPATTLEHQEE